MMHSDKLQHLKNIRMLLEKKEKRSTEDKKALDEAEELQAKVS